jgi:hypothetical protein
MNSTTEFDINNLDAQTLQATLPQGDVYLRLRNLSNAETFSMTTPRGVVTIQNDGRYGIAAGDTQHPILVTVLDGSAQITGDGEPVNVSANATATITGADTFQITVSRAQIDPFLAAMLAHEHPVAVGSTPPPVQHMTGYADLAAYGTWRTDPQYGQVWYPRVAAAGCRIGTGTGPGSSRGAGPGSTTNRGGSHHSTTVGGVLSAAFGRGRPHPSW